MFEKTANKKMNQDDTIYIMLTITILSTLILGIFGMANKAVKEYEYGSNAIKDFERYNKDSFYFK